MVKSFHVKTLHGGFLGGFLTISLQEEALFQMQQMLMFKPSGQIGLGMPVNSS